MVKILFFGSFREIIGMTEVETELEKPSISVKELLLGLPKTIKNIDKIIAHHPTVAVNQEFANKDQIVNDGDEIAFIPPMSGGQDLVRIQEEDFSINEELARVQQSSKSIGGIVTFVGTARDISQGRNIEQMEFEYYPQMAEKKLGEIRDVALKNFDIIEVLIVHRVGKIEIGENIVLIIAAAEHRKDAFEACSWCIDELKRITPIWKKEFTDKGEVWVEEHP